MKDALKLYADAEAKAGQEGSRKRWRMASQALALVTDDAAGQAAFATANATHKRADWRIAARTLAKAVSGAETVVAVAIKPAPAPMSLCEFLSRAGGLRDTGGDLKSMGAHLWHRRAAFRRRLVTDTGLALDYAADLAAERGYVAGYASPTLANGANMDDDLHRVGVVDLLTAIEREIAGSPCYAAESEWAPYVEPEPEDYDRLYEETFPESVEAWA